MTSKSRRAAREAARAEALTPPEPRCPETIGEPFYFELQCDLPPGHEGNHYAEWDW